MTCLREIARSPGDQTIEYKAEPQPAEQHAPEGSKAEEIEDIRPARLPCRQQFILFRMLPFDVPGLGFWINLSVRSPRQSVEPRFDHQTDNSKRTPHRVQQSERSCVRGSPSIATHAPEDLE
jgi:hypothetical protein